MEVRVHSSGQRSLSSEEEEEEERGSEQPADIQPRKIELTPVSLLEGGQMWIRRSESWQTVEGVFGMEAVGILLIYTA